MLQRDGAYFLKRVAAELRMADEAPTAAAAKAHRQLAAEYQKRVDDGVVSKPQK